MAKSYSKTGANGMPSSVAQKVDKQKKPKPAIDYKSDPKYTAPKPSKPSTTGGNNAPKNNQGIAGSAHSTSPATSNTGSNSNSSSGKSTYVPNVPTNLPSGVYQQILASYNKQQAGAPKNTSTSTSRSTSTASSLITFNPLEKYMGTDAAKVIGNTNTALLCGAVTFDDFQNAKETRAVPTFEKLNAVERMRKGIASLPTSVLKAIKASPKSKEEHNKAFKKLVQDVCKEVQPQSLEEILQDTGLDRPKYKVEYMTATAYSQATKTGGYHTVYVEEGGGKLQNKNGIYTIGSDCLSGLPAGTKTVMVDNDGNFKYFADVTKRAEHVAVTTARRDTELTVLENKYTSTENTLKKVQDRIILLDALVDAAGKKAAKTRTAEDIATYQSWLEQRKKAEGDLRVWKSQRYKAADDYAVTYKKYADAIADEVGWTTDDEDRYATISGSLKKAKVNAMKSHYGGIPSNVVTDADIRYKTLLEEYNTMDIRRNQYKDAPMFLSSDYIAKMQQDTEYMSKLIDEYNRWDSVTIHTEDGEGLGQQLRKTFLVNISGEDNMSRAKALADAGAPTEEIVAAMNDADYGVWDALSKPFKVFGVAYQDLSKARTAYKNGDITVAEYTREEDKVFTQAKSILFNNALANVDVFDLFSLQQEFVAWRMLEHPDRYEDDPKFKKLQEAYKKIWGTDYNGGMDGAVKAMQTQFQIEKGAFDDYLYLSGSDLRHANGEQYGLAASFAVGTLTDVTNIVKFAGKGIEMAATKATKGTVRDALHTSLKDTLVAQGMDEATARRFLMSDAVTKQLDRAAKNIVKDTMHNADEFTTLFRNSQQELLSDFASKNVDNIFSDIMVGSRAEFLEQGAELMRKYTPDAVEQSFVLNKGLVAATALTDVGEMMDEFQTALFKTANPLVTATATGLHKGFTAIKTIINNNAAGKILAQETSELMVTGKRVLAKAAGLDYDAAVDSKAMHAAFDAVYKEFTDAALAQGDKTSDLAKRLLGDYGMYTMRTSADGYASGVLNKYARAIRDGGVDALNKLAQDAGFSAFDDMYNIIRENLESLSMYSPDIDAIIKNFDVQYNQACVIKALSGGAQYIEAINTHLDALDRFTKELTSITDNVNFTQGISMTLADSISNFTKTMNPEWSVLHTVGNDVVSVETYAVRAMDALDNITYGVYNDADIIDAVTAVKEYAEVLDVDYIKQATDWYKDALFAGEGATGYLDNIKKYAMQKPADEEAVRKIVANKIVDAVRDAGYNIDQTDVLVKVLRTESDVANLNADQFRRLYRVTMNKGTNVMAQISNKDFIELTTALADPTNMANRVLSMTEDYLSALPPSITTTRAMRDIRKSITNASAVNATTRFSESLKQLDGLLQNSVLDSYAGHAYEINHIAQTLPHDQAVAKITSMLVNDTQQQMAKHAGNYELLHNMGANTLDVAANVRRIDAILTEQGFAADDKYIDICFSMNNTTHFSAPNDVSFFVRGSSDAPFTLHQSQAFAIKDNELARRLYGKTADEVVQEYAGLTVEQRLSRSEFNEQLQQYIKAQQELALQENKTIRFIGFNSSDAVSGQNNYLYSLMQQSGISINTANAIDYADVMRMNNAEYVLDSDAVTKIREGVSNALHQGRADNVALGMPISIAYDPKYTCTEILSDALKNSDALRIEADGLKEGLEYIKEMTNAVQGELNSKAFEKTGTALGMLIDEDALEHLLRDAGSAPDTVRINVMNVLQNSLKDGTDQLGTNKIIDMAYTAGWFDVDKLNSAVHLGASNAAFLEEAHSYATQLNAIYNSISRIDLLSDDKADALRSTYKYIVSNINPKSRTFSAVSCINIDAITDARQLYALNTWVYDMVTKDSADLADKLTLGLLNVDSPIGSLILPGGRGVVTNGTVDYTDDLLRPFITKYLDPDETGYALAQDLQYYAKVGKTFDSLADYDRAMSALYNMNNIHGAADKVHMMQLAAIYKPIQEFQDGLEDVYKRAVGARLDAIYTTYGKQFDKDVANKMATSAGVSAMKKRVAELGAYERSQAVNSVIGLDEEAFKAHLIRNCGNGLVIDPNAQCMRGIDLPTVFEQWKSYKGVIVEEFNYTNGIIKDRPLFRVFLDTTDIPDDALFARYNNANITFHNSATDRFAADMRGASFGASDMSLTTGDHMASIREQFFGDAHMLDMKGRYASWTDELYSCNMWTDSDLKQIVNPYYTDNVLTSLAQSTHTVRRNASAMHDLGTLINNDYMRSGYVLSSAGIDLTKGAESVKVIKKQLAAQKYKLCTVVEDGGKMRLVDFTDKLTADNLDKILSRTVCVDDNTYRTLNDWRKATTVAIMRETQSSPATAFSHAYKLYKDTIRSATVAMYLYGNVGTAVRNMVDSSVKAYNEVRQYDVSMQDFLRNYKNAVPDSRTYSDIYRAIEEEFGAVDAETVRRFFASDVANDFAMDMDKFNRFRAYDVTLSGSSLVNDALEDVREAGTQHFLEGAGHNMHYEDAEKIRKIIDGIYARRIALPGKDYANMSTAERAKHLTQIHDECMKAIDKEFHDEIVKGWIDIQDISKKFYSYTPTTQTWGERLTNFVPPMRTNQRLFNDAETRARLSLYNTFIDAGVSDAEAIAHVSATQFDYAGIGKVEDIMPFTQYKLYNAAYWFEHAGRDAIADAWRFAQYNDDGSMTNAEIARECAKYQTRQYYLYEKDSADKEYKNFVESNLTSVGHLVLDGVDSYLGLPREFQAGAVDLNGTHYIKLGNSFVEETDLVLSITTGIMSVVHGLQNLSDSETGREAMRMAYDALKYTPLYDSMYSPWKSWMDLAVYKDDLMHDEIMKKAACVHLGIPYKEDIEFSAQQLYHLYTSDKSTRSEALAGIPVVGAIAANLSTRFKNFDLNLGELLTLLVVPDVQRSAWETIRDGFLDVAGMVHPSLIGTKVSTEYQPYQMTYDYFMRIDNPSEYINLAGRLQKMGFSEEDTDAMLDELTHMWENGLYFGKQQYLDAAKELLANGYSLEETKNLLAHYKTRWVDGKRYIDIPGTKEDNMYLALFNALPDYLRYDDKKRKELLDFYKAMGFSTADAYAQIISHPAVIVNGKLVSLDANGVAEYNAKQLKTYLAKNSNLWTEQDWQNYWDSMPFRYPKGEWKEVMAYLQRCGYSYAEAREMCRKGFMLDDNKNLVDVQGQARAKMFSSNRLSDEEWDAYWATVPDTMKYSKGAYGRTMKALKKMGYTDVEARQWVQLGIYVTKQGIMINTAEYNNFNRYYQSLPDYIKYEKGTYKLTHAALKALGFDEYESRVLIKQGAYRMDVTAVKANFTTLGARRDKNGKVIPVTDINSLLAAYGGQIIAGANGSAYMLVDCSGLKRPRKTYSYSRRRRGGGRRYTRRGYTKRSYTPRAYKSKFVPRPKVSKPIKHYYDFHVVNPYITKGSNSSTYSKVNVLHGASFGYRQIYKVNISMNPVRKTMSSKSSYPAAYRNIVYAYRRNMYKDQYAKYGASRMQMRANAIRSYSNAAITRLRRNEIQNRLKYANRRPVQASTRFKPNKQRGVR